MALADPVLTPADYLALERRAEGRGEYVDGERLAMGGASRAHNLIALNLAAELRAALRGRPCEVYAADMRVKVERPTRYFYPDVAVACDGPRFEDAEVDTLLDPRLVAEVLSSSTEAFDRGEKFRSYQRLASLSDFLLLDQHRPRIEHFQREASNRWRLVVYEGREGTLPIGHLDVALPIAELYARVRFDAG